MVAAAPIAVAHRLVMTQRAMRDLAVPPHLTAAACHAAAVDEATLGARTTSDEQIRAKFHAVQLLFSFLLFRL